MSHVTCHMPHVTYHVSHFLLVCCYEKKCKKKLYIYFFRGQFGGPSWWRVCYQRGLPRLVNIVSLFGQEEGNKVKYSHLPERTAKGKGLYFTVHPQLGPNTDKL